MTKNTVRVISGGTSYYLSGSGTAYTGSGSPWTVETTSPYELALNEATGNIWVPQAAPRQTQYLGTPPFNVGRLPLYTGYDNVTETVGMHLRADTKDNAIALLRQLRRILNTALYTNPAQLGITGGTDESFYEIYSADVQELPTYLYEGGTGGGIFRAAVTWTRSATASRRTTAQSLLNATLQNRASGTPDNNDAYSAGAGEMIYEGSPLNLVITGNNSSGLTYGGVAPFYLATISSVSYASAATSVTGTSVTILQRSVDVSTLLTNRALRVRLCVEAKHMNSSTYQVMVWLGTGTSGNLIYTGPKVSNLASGINGFFDLGWLPNDIVRQAKGMTAPTIYFEVYAVSSAGSQNYTCQGSQVIFYYDWCNFFVTSSTFQGNQILQVDAFPEQTNTILLPYTPRGLIQNTSTSPKISVALRGTAPRYFEGSRLYFAAVRTDATYSSSDNWTFVATHAPQYLTLRGGG